MTKHRNSRTACVAFSFRSVSSHTHRGVRGQTLVFASAYCAFLPRLLASKSTGRTAINSEAGFLVPRHKRQRMDTQKKRPILEFPDFWRHFSQFHARARAHAWWWCLRCWFLLFARLQSSLDPPIRSRTEVVPVTWNSAPSIEVVTITTHCIHRNHRHREATHAQTRPLGASANVVASVCEV